MITDFLGREIKVGRVVVYPVRHRTKMWLNKMQVDRFEQPSTEESTIVHGHNAAGNRVRLTNTRNLVVINDASL